MSTATLRELHMIPAPVGFEQEASQNGTVAIKGFVSVEVEDRSGDLVPPDEFKIDQFMAAPTMLVNHKYWQDSQGNSVGVGRPIQLDAAKISANKSSDSWNIVSLRTKQVISTFPKAKVPNLVAGDKGLFVKAVITQPDVVKMVQRGELSAFSWRGLATVDYRMKSVGSGTERIFKNIDMYEISLVNVPDNPNSTFMVGKALDTEPLVISIMKLERSRFETLGMAQEYLKSHNLDIGNIAETPDAFMAHQYPMNQFNLSKLITVKMADGVHVVAGPIEKGLPLSPSDPWNQWETKPLSEEQVKMLEQTECFKCSDKFKRCVQHVKDLGNQKYGDKYNPYAVCQASVNKKNVDLDLVMKCIDMVGDIQKGVDFAEDLQNAGFGNVTQAVRTEVAGHSLADDVTVKTQAEKDEVYAVLNTARTDDPKPLNTPQEDLVNKMLHETASMGDSKIRQYDVFKGIIDNMLQEVSCTHAARN